MDVIALGKRNRPDSDVSPDYTMFSNKRRRTNQSNQVTYREFKAAVKEMRDGGFIKYVIAVTGRDYTETYNRERLEEEWFDNDLTNARYRTFMIYIRQYFFEKYTKFVMEPAKSGLRRECHPMFLWKELLPALSFVCPPYLYVFGTLN